MLEGFPRFLLIFLLLVFIDCEAYCRDYEIEELLEIAKQNSTNIKVAEYAALSQKQFANQQKYWDNPVISLGKLGNKSTYTISQSVPFYNKRQTNYNLQKSEYDILETRKKNTALFVQAEVFRLIYRYQGLKQKIVLTEKRLERLFLVDKYLATIVLSSPTRKAQWRITKNKIDLVERDLINFHNQLYQTWNAANVYLNLSSEPENIRLKWLDEKNYPGKNFFIDTAIESNLDIKEQKLLIGKYKSGLYLAKIETMPDINVTVTQENGPTSSAGGINQNSTGVGLSMSLPLLNRNQEKIASMWSKIKAEELSLEFKRQQLIQSVNNDISDYETSLRVAKHFPISNIDRIISQLSQANIDFKRGVLDFITYIELDSQEYQNIDTVINTQVELADAYSRLLVKIGNFTLPKSTR